MVHACEAVCAPQRPAHVPWFMAHEPPQAALHAELVHFQSAAPVSSSAEKRAAEAEHALAQVGSAVGGVGSAVGGVGSAVGGVS